MFTLMLVLRWWGVILVCMRYLYNFMEIPNHAFICCFHMIWYTCFLDVVELIIPISYDKGRWLQRAVLAFAFFPYFSKNAWWDFVLTLLYYSWHDHKNGKGLQSLSITSSSRRLSLLLLIAPPTGFDNHTKAVASLQDRNKFWSNSTTVFRYWPD